MGLHCCTNNYYFIYITSGLQEKLKTLLRVAINFARYTSVVSFGFSTCVGCFIWLLGYTAQCHST